MLVKNCFVAALAGLAFAGGARLMAQGSPPATAPPAPTAQTPASQTTPLPAHRAGRFVPEQRRPPGDPAQIAHGKALYGVSCAGCHGPDLRGGDLGGPNLLRSQVALSDLKGELILPIIQGSRQDAGMPAIPSARRTG